MQVPNIPAQGNDISHWRVNMQAQSFKCNFINITTSVRWPTLLSSVGVLSACDANTENTHGSESKAAGVDFCLHKTGRKQTQVTQSSIPVSGLFQAPKKSRWVFAFRFDPKPKDLFSLLNDILQLTPVRVGEICSMYL